MSNLTLVLLRLLCVAILLVVIAITYVILQNLGEKGIKIFRNSIVRWGLSFATGILLFLLAATLIFT